MRKIAVLLALLAAFALAVVPAAPAGMSDGGLASAHR